MKLSTVIPVYNEVESLRKLHGELSDVAREQGYDLELIFVDDGSTDRSWEAIEQLGQQDPRVRGIQFRRNFGKSAALSAGFAAASGELIFTLDADLQDDPREMPKFLAEIERGCDVVSGWKRKRHDPWHKIGPSRIFNWLVGILTGVRLHDHNCGFKCYRHAVFDEVRLYGEMHRFVPIYASWQGARVTEMPVNHHPRTRGKSNYGIERTLKVVLDLIVVKFLASYATKPIYVFGGFGLLSLFASVMAFLWALFYKLTGQKDFVETPLPLVVVMLLLVGCLSILLGLVAELTIRTYYESQGKRTYTLHDDTDVEPKLVGVK